MPAPLFHLQPDQFLDTTEGQNWLTGAVDDLIEGVLYIDGRVRHAEVIELEDALADHVGTKYSAGEDYDGALGQVLRNVLAGDIDKAAGALRLLISKQEVRAMAEELVRPLVDKYVESIKEDEE